MKSIYSWFLFGFFVFVFASYYADSVSVSTAQPVEPVFMQSGDLAFSLEKMDGHDALPYKSGPAFWFKNGDVIDVASHCGELPGDRFKELSVGSIIEVTYNDGSTRNLAVYDEIEIRYESTSKPYTANWIDQSTGIGYSPMEFTTILATQKGAYMFHSSVCTKEFSVGQRFWMAK